MTVDPEMIAKAKAVMAECLAEEVTLWQSKSRKVAKSDLAAHGGRLSLEKEYKGAIYNLVIDQLADDDDMLTILLDIQPNDLKLINLIAVPRVSGQSGYSNENMGMLSEIIFLKT